MKRTPIMTIKDDNFETTIEQLDCDSVEDARALLEQLMHDCPECRAARERGETPQIVDLQALRPDNSVLRRRRPRWRELKRVARR